MCFTSTSVAEVGAAIELRNKLARAKPGAHVCVSRVHLVSSLLPLPACRHMFSAAFLCCCTPTTSWRPLQHSYRCGLVLRGETRVQWG